MSPPSDISHLADDDLLRLLAGRDVPKVGLPELWAKSEGYYPGQTRVLRSELYQKFRNWAKSQGHAEITNTNTWGFWMGQNFKRGRSKHGIFYYISRMSTERMR